jgi:hypothetical protein
MSLFNRLDVSAGSRWERLRPQAGKGGVLDNPTIKKEKGTSQK